MQKKVLYIGWCMPYDTVSHAGGQDLNYYIKRMTEQAEVKLITIALPGEREKATIEKYGVDARYIELEKLPDIKLKKVMSLNSKLNPFHRLGHITTKYKADEILSETRKLRDIGYKPDVVVLQWTQVILLISDIKKIFPETRIIAVEVDVTYLRLQREAEIKKGFEKLYARIVYENEKRREIIALNESNVIYTNNYKDKKLLLREEIEDKKIKVLVPYYHKYDVKEWQGYKTKDIMFFGDMGRAENYEAAIWFIESILPKIVNKQVRFVIVGGHAQTLEKYQSERVIVTGYVEDPSVYFANSAMFIAPLQKGAGIKIKVLEAMSSGIPVITTDVGIEGIPAEDGVDYLRYNTDDELIKCIDLIMNNKELGFKIGGNGKKMLAKHFNILASVNEYIAEVVNL